MPCIVNGVVLQFTFKSSNEIQPGEVPGPGGLFHEFTCDGCGWEYRYRAFGYFAQGERELLRSMLFSDLVFHAQNCPRVPKLEDLDVTSMRIAHV